MINNNKYMAMKNFRFLIFALVFLSAPAMAGAETIRLRVEASGNSLFNGDLTVLPCKPTPEAETETLNAKCAIEQSGLVSDFSYWGEDAFLNFIGDYANNQDGNGVYWGYFLNLEYGQLALNKQAISENDVLLLTYNTNPLKIEVSSSTPAIGGEVEVLLSQFGLDESWNPAWTPAAGSTLVINGEEKENAEGVYRLLIGTTTPFSVFGKKDGFLDSREITITGQEIIEDEEPSDEEDELDEEPPTNTGSSGGGSYTPPAISEMDINKAGGYLLGSPNADGSIGNVMVTDWAAIALSAYGQPEKLEKIKSYYASASDSGFGLTDNLRRAMALMALNISPYNGLKTDYIGKIVKSFDGTQFGDKDYFNDDIFSLLVLQNAGYGPSDEIIKKEKDYILSGQDANGGFGGVDLTAAAIQALQPLSTEAGVGEAIAKARNYLSAGQKDDGGFGNSFSTGWALMAINSLGENPGQWVKNSKDPKKYLAGLQDADGGLEKGAEPVNRLWTTAYAIPAAMGKSWNGLMHDFSKVETVKEKNPAGPGEENGEEDVNLDEEVEEDIEESEDEKDIDEQEEEAPRSEESEEKKKVLGVKTGFTGDLTSEAKGEILKTYFDAFGKNPETEEEWSDVNKIAYGRWPGKRSLERETAVTADFVKIYFRQPDMNKPYDNAAITIMAYGLRPEREVIKEQAALRTFVQVYGRLPGNYQDWNIIRAIAYSGAKR